MDEAILKRALGGYSDEEDDNEEDYEPTAAEGEEEAEDHEEEEEDETEIGIRDQPGLAPPAVTEFDAAELKAIEDVQTVLEPLELPAIPPLELPVEGANLQPTAASEPSLPLAVPSLPDLPFAYLPLPLPLPLPHIPEVSQPRQPPPQKVGPARRLVRVRDLQKQNVPAPAMPLPFEPHQKLTPSSKASPPLIVSPFFLTLKDIFHSLSE